MPVDIVVPPLSQTMDTVVLVEWMKEAGDQVERGENLFAIETEKAILEIESPASGVLRQVLVEPGTEVEVGEKIGTITGAGESLSDQEETEPAVAQDAAPPPAISTAPGTAAGAAVERRERPAEQEQRILSSPRARRLAKQEAVDLAVLAGSGSEGMIVERDVEEYLSKQGRAGAAGQPVTMSPLRQIIARRMLESHQTTAPVTLTREVDATELVHLREQLLEDLTDEDVRPTYTDLLISLVARCLRRHPALNARRDGANIIVGEQVHIAMAVDTERGLLVPVIRDADCKELSELTRERAELVRRATDGNATPEQLIGGTFTITNLGALGIDAFTPIINLPQVAVLGVGRIRPAPAVHEGELCIRHLMHLSLTFDHRVVDGAPAAHFLQDLAELIEEPSLI